MSTTITHHFNCCRCGHQCMTSVFDERFGELFEDGLNRGLWLVCAQCAEKATISPDLLAPHFDMTLH